MFDLDNWLGGEQRSDRYKQVTAIELPYKCGKIEAEIIFSRFINHEKPSTYLIIQPLQTRVLLR
jgi:hypothetical protein